MKLLLLTFGLLSIALLGIAIKLWAKKTGNFQVLVQVKTQCLIKMVKLVVFAENQQMRLEIAMNLNM